MPQKISQMNTAATPLTGAEIIPGLQGGANVRTTVDDVGARARVPLALTTGAALVGTADGGTVASLIVSKLSRVVDSITALKALVKTQYTHAFVTGYYAAGDGGGGAYWYDSTDTTSVDNGGTIIVASDGGRWKLQITDWVSVKQFGAKGDGITDDTTSCQGATNAMNAAGGGTVFHPSGTYLNTGLTLKSNVTWLGADNATTILKNTNNAHGVTINNISGHSIVRMTISQAGNANAVDCLSITDGSNALFEDVCFDTPGRDAVSMLGGVVSGNFNNLFVRPSITNLSGTKRGFYLKAGAGGLNNANIVFGGRCNNGAYGVYIDTNAGVGNSFNWDVQSQTTAGYYVDSSNNTVLGYMEPIAGADCVQLTTNAGSSFIAPNPCTVSAGGQRVRVMSGAPNYTYIAPAGSGENSRFYNLSAHSLIGDVGGSTAATGYAPVGAKLQYVAYTTSTNVEEVAWSYSLPAGALVSNGDTLTLRLWGTTNIAGASKQVNVYFGAAGTRTVATFNSSTASVLPWVIDVEIQRVGAALESSISSCRVGSGPSFNVIDQREVSPNQDTTAAIAMSVGLTAGVGATVTLTGLRLFITRAS